MTDIGKTIAPKSDQLNADDLIGKDITIEITGVSGTTGDQPISIHYKGDNGKPYKPCKSMRRLLVALWGNDGSTYAGRGLTLYRDDKVKFGGIAVGGIRISHMTHIDKEHTLALTESRASRKPFTVKPLVLKPTTQATAPTTPLSAEEIDAAYQIAYKGSKALEEWWVSLRATAGAQTRHKDIMPDLKAKAAEADENLLNN